jgi:hypothetical protein
MEAYAAACAGVQDQLVQTPSILRRRRLLGWDLNRSKHVMEYSCGFCLTIQDPGIRIVSDGNLNRKGDLFARISQFTFKQTQLHITSTHFQTSHNSLHYFTI